MVGEALTLALREAIEEAELLEQLQGGEGEEGALWEHAQLPTHRHIRTPIF